MFFRKHPFGMEQSSETFRDGSEVSLNLTVQRVLQISVPVDDNCDFLARKETQTYDQTYSSLRNHGLSGTMTKEHMKVSRTSR